MKGTRIILIALTVATQSVTNISRRTKWPKLNLPKLQA
jgi:hypothetical protein